MSENGGIMEVSLSVFDIGKDEATQDIELNQGKYVKITVSDTGHGIPKEHLDRIFDPYFTTKEVGEGSGIGLSVVYGIVKSYDGAISVDSEYGKGTTFNVFLPVVEKEPAFEEETDTTMPTGYERILFVDDEESIADMTGQMLKRLGYTVTVKTSSMDTLETFRAQPDNFDLIISDMSMPGITGDKLAKELQTVRPNIPIILCTGYSERINDEKAKSIGVRALVMKPIVKNELAKTIRKVLDGNE
jgi:CheY-like chemotaxis protein